MANDGQDDLEKTDLFEEAYRLVEISMKTQSDGKRLYMCPLRKRVYEVDWRMDPKSAYRTGFDKVYKKMAETQAGGGATLLQLFKLPTESQWKSKVREMQETKWKIYTTWETYPVTFERGAGTSEEQPKSQKEWQELLDQPAKDVTEKRKMAEKTEEQSEDSKKSKTDEPIPVPVDHVVTMKDTPSTVTPAPEQPDPRAGDREGLLAILSSSDKMFYLLKLRDYLKTVQRMKYLIYLRKGWVEMVTYFHRNPPTQKVEAAHHPYFEQMGEQTLKRIVGTMDCSRYQ